MRLGRNLGILLLGIWLILTGLVSLGLNIPGIILAVLAIIAGVLILFDWRSTTRNLGYLLLAIWLILTGLFVLIPSLNFSGRDTIMAILAIAAGVLVLLRR